MKLVIFAVLLVIATSQTVTTLCPGFKNAGTCFNSAVSSGLTNPAIDGCTAYTNPKECSACGTGLKTNTEKTKCQYDVAYAHYTYWPSSETDYKNCINYIDSYAAYASDLTKLVYTSQSCIDSNKQLLCRCKPGFVFISSTLKCSACGSGCATCKSDTTSYCYTCNAGYFLGATNACATCTTNALTCSSATKAASCVAGYYLKSEDGTCVACPTNSTCTSATVFTCNAGYYNASGTCTLCGNNVALCTGVTSTTASTNITECIKPDGTNIYYLTAKGCQAVLGSKYCLTAKEDTTWKCDTCLYGYVNSEGSCYPCQGSQFTNVAPSGAVTYATIINTCTTGSYNTKATITCKDGYILVTASAQCQTCASQTGLTNCTKCSSTTICTTCDAGYQVKADGTSCIVCGEAAICKECTLNGSNAFKKCTTYLDNAKVQTGGVDDGALAAVASVATYGVASCATGLLWLADATQYSGPSGAKMAKCLTCAAGYALFADGITATAGQSKCEKSATSLYDNFANCKLGQQVTTVTVAAKTDVKCTECNATFFVSGLACAACSDATNCAVCTSASAGACTKCQNSKVLGGGACLTGVTNCKADTATTTYNKHNGTAVTCDECAATHIKKADGTSCIDCAAITNCKTKVAVDASCGCSECNVDLTNEYYYYLTGTGAQTCTKDKPSNCGYHESDGKAATCYYCNVGYKWNATNKACEACSTTFVCLTVADVCSTLNYPGKPSAAAAAAAANSSIISLVLSLLLALITLLI